MATWLKKGSSAEQRAEVNRGVRDTVERTLAEIEQRGDAAVRELSIRFDNWDREDYRLSDAEIARCIDSLSPQARADIEFAQAQVRNFARIQRAALQEIGRASCRERVYVLV